MDWSRSLFYLYSEDDLDLLDLLDYEEYLKLFTKLQTIDETASEESLEEFQVRKHFEFTQLNLTHFPNTQHRYVGPGSKHFPFC